MSKEDLSYERINELFQYNPDNGRLYWKTPRGTKVKAGDLVSGMDKDCYYCVRLREAGTIIRQHHIVWMLHHKQWPNKDLYIDHIDGNSTNNRIENLREVTPQVSAQNQARSCANQTGQTGVFFNKQRNMYEAYIWHDYKKIRLAYTPSLELAIQVRKEAEKKFLFHENHGKARSK